MTLDTFRRLLNGDINLNSRNRSHIRQVARATDPAIHTGDTPPSFEVNGTSQVLASLPQRKHVDPGHIGAHKQQYEGELFFPGLPFDAVMFAEHIDREEVTSPFTPNELLGMSARQFIGATTGRAKRDFGQIRKLGKQFATQPMPEDLMALSIGAGLHTRRLMLTTDFLQGKSAPVIEFRLIDHWMKHVGLTLPDPKELMLSGDMLENSCQPSRLIVVRQYQEMLLPILADLRHQPREKQLNPDARAWAIFNAWWAIASLYGEVGIIRDVSPLWPEAAALFAHTSEAIYGTNNMLDLSVSEPLYPIGSHAEFEFIKAFSKVGATTPDLINNCDILEEELPDLLDGFDALAESRRQRVAMFERQHRDAIMAIYSRYRRLAGASLFERVASASATVEHTSADLGTLEPLTAHFAEIEEILENEAECAGIDVANADGTLASDAVVAAMTTWMHDADALCRSIEQEIDGWNESLRQAAETHGSLAERMAATQRAGEQFAEWQAESQDALAEMIERAMQLPWPGVMAIDLSYPDPDEGGPDAGGPVAGDSEPSPEEQIAALKEEVGQLDKKMKHHRHRAWVLEQQLDSAKASREAYSEDTHSAEVIGALRAFSDNTSCPNVLSLLQAAYPDRVRVLPSAMASASDADSSLSATGLLRKAHALVVDGWEILADNRPPYDMQEVIPSELALNESDSTRQDTRCMQQRTFQEKPEGGPPLSWTMSWHLKLDNRHRLYFAWDEQAKQIVIGHAGAHLGLAAIRS